MSQAIAAWLTDTLPPESYDAVRWASGHFDLARPMLIAGFALYLAVLGLVACGVVAMVRRL